MPSYNVRISRPYDQISPWIKTIKADKVLAVQHDSDKDIARTHTHILIVNSPVEALTLKHRLKRLHGQFTKGDWAFPELKDTDYERIATYYSKGKYDYSYMIGFEFDWEDIKTKWIEPNLVQTLIRTNGTHTRPDKMTHQEMVQQIKNMIIEENDHSIDNIISKIRQVFIIQNKRIIGRFKVRDIVDTLMAEFEPSNWTSSIKRLCEYRT